MSTPQVTFTGRDSAGGDFRRVADIPSGGKLRFDAQGNVQGIPPLETITYFSLLPAASALATGDPYFLASGTGTEVVARAAKGGVNLKTQASTPADADNFLLTPSATGTGGYAVLRAASMPRLETRVSINTITALFASFGFNENITDADPGGTAGEGAMFLFAPTGPGTTELTVDTGLTLAQHGNWLIANKVDGADTFADTGVVVVAGADYELVIQIGSDFKARYYINGALVGTGPTLTDGDTLAAMIGLELTGTPGGQKDVDVRYLSVARSIG